MSVNIKQDSHLPTAQQKQSKKNKSKKTTALLALFLGSFGIHRFYLGHYFIGFLYILFCWTYIPTFVSILESIIFYFLPEEKFDESFNRIKKCSTCNEPLSFMTTPNLGGGKLNDNGQICRSCFAKITKIDINFTLHSKTKYNTEQALKILNQFPQNSFPHSYYLLLKNFIPSLQQLVNNLQSNNEIIEHIHLSKTELSTVAQLIQHCVIYDIAQISFILANEQFKPNSVENAGLVLIINSLSAKKHKNILNKQNFNEITKEYQKGTYTEMAEKIKQIYSSESPMQITIREIENEAIVSSKTTQNQLSFPAFLHISKSPLHKEYATILYRYATITAKANNTIIDNKKNSLQKIYQLLNNPFPEKKDTIMPTQNAKPNETLNDVLDELNALIGLDEVKKEINTLVNFIKIQKIREKKGLKLSSLSYHMVFMGNPGTGKTTVARIIAKIYKHLGILTKGQFVETERSGLVAAYAGQTAPKVNKIIDKALNGVLFIDEAYALVGKHQDDYGEEAVATLIKRMEDNRDKLVVILAGYTQEMKNFIETNSGFKSRFNRYIHFPDYSPSELCAIFESKCQKLDYRLTEKAKIKLQNICHQSYTLRDNSFGNGRFARNLFEKTLEHQANRIAKQNHLTKEILTTINEEDIQND